MVGVRFPKSGVPTGPLYPLLFVFLPSHKSSIPFLFNFATEFHIFNDELTIDVPFPLPKGPSDLELIQLSS